MEAKVDPKFEALICRSLDGALSDDEQLTLNRELLRNPAARRRMDQYQANDALAGEALGVLLSAGAGGAAPPPSRFAEPTDRPTVDWSALVSSPWSAAAALLAALTLWLVVDYVVEETPVNVAVNRSAVHVADGSDAGSATDGTAAMARSSKLPPRAGWPGETSPVAHGRLADVADKPLIDQPHAAERTTDRAFMGVYDEPDDTFYFLEVDREEAKMWAEESEL